MIDRDRFTVRTIIKPIEPFLAIDERYVELKIDNRGDHCRNDR